MTSECLLCGDGTNTTRFTLPSVIKVLHTVISALETRYNEENEANEDALRLKVEELSAGSESLKDEKRKAERRADLYKQRFLAAQKTIQVLHEKNVQLSNSQKEASKPPSFFLFESPATSISRITETANETILAPDTCGFDLIKPGLVKSSISSDEEDFQERQSRKSPKTSKTVIKQKKNTIESYFKSPAMRVKTENAIDLEETRLDVGNSMDVSVSISDTGSELDKTNEEINSLKPSPVLTSLRHRLSLRKCTKRHKSEQSVFQSNDQNKAVDPEETFISEKNEANRKDICAILTPKKGNTSLDEIFDKTYGDLDTTSMLLADTCGNTEVDKYDEDLDQLLFDDVKRSSNGLIVKTLKMPPSMGQSTRSGQGRTLFDDSFDTPPKKEIVFKPNEVVRKKDEREKLESRACPQCDAYYSDLPASERKNVLKKLCRHKIVNSPPLTPENFWEVEIPSTAECRRRGYITDETIKGDSEKQNTHTFRRKRPLQPFHGNKELSS